jgi:NADH-quinone oxidoreductase subunit N
MSAPILWIILPVVAGSFMLLMLNERAVAIAGGITCVLLAILAAFVPFDQALLLGPFSFKIVSSANFLGRTITLPPLEAHFLALIFGVCAMWFFGADAAGVASRLVPWGLFLTALLVASIAVQPFLYAALLIEAAVLLAVPLLAPPGAPPGRGVIRFLIYQTLGMPFILLSGWLLAGVESSPGNLSLTLESTVMLALGFAFLLAIVPLNDWMPRIMEECNPYVGGFLLWLLPNIIVVFAMSLLDRYAWLRTSPEIVAGLRAIGVVMLIWGGLWAAFENHLGRIMGYAAITQTGLLLMAMSLAAGSSSDLVFAFLIPRGLALVVWALALSRLLAGGLTLRLPSVQGSLRTHPWPAGALIAATLSIAGFPLLGGFAPRAGLWTGIAGASPGTAIWFAVGLLALILASARQAAVMARAPENAMARHQEGLIERGMLGLGVGALFVLGLFPQSADFIVQALPMMFEHLGR